MTLTWLPTLGLLTRRSSSCLLRRLSIYSTRAPSQSTRRGAKPTAGMLASLGSALSFGEAGGKRVHVTPPELIGQLPPRLLCRVQKHHLADGQLRFQVWYPALAAGTPESHQATGPDAWEVVRAWAWRRHEDWLASGAHVG